MTDIDTSKATQLDQWATVHYHADRSPWTAPERWPVSVVAIWPNGKQRVTSPVQKAVGRYIVTQSGSVYKLGTPHQEFLKAVAKKGRKFDPENPISFRVPR